MLYQTYGTAFITTFLLTSTWLTVTMATLRYVAICHPLCMRKVDANKLSKFSYIFSAIFATCLNLPAFGEYRIDPLQTSPSNSSQKTFHYIMDLGYFSSASNHGHMFMWSRAILGIFVPAAIMTFCRDQLPCRHQSNSIHISVTAECVELCKIPHNPRSTLFMWS